uniref:Uncharacterized protein n=1 Tax=uncultured marine thaumarchaeote KM3_82_D05 TaxID=1456304 RepID=A0A075HX48_9ARCH|nr:hypothetical protein [uncultured marine thaumarchaeote KM3_82_D05]
MPCSRDCGLRLAGLLRPFLRLIAPLLGVVAGCRVEEGGPLPACFHRGSHSPLVIEIRGHVGHVHHQCSVLVVLGRYRSHDVMRPGERIVPCVLHRVEVIPGQHRQSSLRSNLLDQAALYIESLHGRALAGPFLNAVAPQAPRGLGRTG